MTPFRALFQQRLLKFVSVRLQRTATQAQLTAAPCNSLQFTATHCKATHLIHVPQQLHCNTLQLQLTASHCKSLQVTASHCKSLQVTATQCNTTHCKATHLLHVPQQLHCNTPQLQLPATHCNSLPHTATQHPATQHTCSMSPKGCHLK